MGFLIALDNQPGVRPVGIGDVVCHLLAKAVSEIAGEEATHTCGKAQLCRGLAEGIEGGIHAMGLVWSQLSFA